MINMVNDMKKILKLIKGIIIGIWVVIAIFTTVCLISYNEFSVTQFGKTSLIIIDNNDLEPTFKENDLVVVSKDSEKSYKSGDLVFFYENNKDQENFISCAKITEVIADKEAEYSYAIDDTRIPYSGIIGSASGATKISTFGLILSILESRWGYMFLVILPTLFLFVYEIYAIVMEVKKDVKEEMNKEE